MTTDNEFDFDAIIGKAKASFNRHLSVIKGQQITKLDDPEWHIANEAWQAATAESDKRIAELLRDYKAQSDFDEEMIKIDTKTITELQAHINVLREALEEINNQNISLEKHGVAMTYINKQSIKTLEITPAQSLIQHDNEVIERVVTLLKDSAWDDGIIDMRVDDLIEDVRKLKGK